MSHPQLSLWLSSAGAAPSELEFPHGAEFSADGRSVEPLDQLAPGAGRRGPIAIVPSSSPESPALAIVAARARFELRRNGAPLRPGVHLLRHADRLELGELVLWVSAEGRPVECAYDPEVHGRDVHCLRTKVRLRAGEPIVICPGTPSLRCRSIYRKAAWAIGVRCHACGFDPAGPRWRPPVPRKEGRIHELLGLVAAR